jgi:hypothetical protein
LDFRAAYGAVPAFCLNVDDIEPQAILVDHTVDSPSPARPTVRPASWRDPP